MGKDGARLVVHLILSPKNMGQEEIAKQCRTYYMSSTFPKMYLFKGVSS